MSDVNKLLREEAEHAEQHKDAAPSVSTRVSRPGHDRAKILSVRLNDEELDQLTARAEMAGVGASTLARSLILQALNPAGGAGLSNPWMESVSQRLARLEEQVEAHG
ncbi:MAG: hypothetical protein ACR2FG_14380 [Marmoricola sp.]